MRMLLKCLGEKGPYGVYPRGAMFDKKRISFPNNPSTGINPVVGLIMIFVFSFLLCGTLSAKPTVKSALSKKHARPPVKVRMAILKDGSEEVEVSGFTLLGRDGDVLLAQEIRKGRGLTRIHKSRVTRCEFLLNYERSDVATALRSHDWAAAVRILSPAVRLVLPYIDIKNNTGLELAMDLGLYMVSSADREMSRISADSADRERAFKQYDAAYNLFSQVGKAEWSPFGQVARLKACRALLAQGKVDQAVEMFEALDSPFPSDEAYGHYCLVQAELLQHQKKMDEALNAVVKSVVFANKDVETFPSSLLFSADCYAGLGQYHRARDIYYEVAVLFVGTDWETAALTGLAAIIDGKKTAENEKTLLENVFFNTEEDMNKLASDLLEKRKPAAKKEDR